MEFDTTLVDNKWWYVYSGYSAEEEKTYSAFIGNGVYIGVTNPQIVHSAPPA